MVCYASALKGPALEAVVRLNAWTGVLDCVSEISSD